MSTRQADEENLGPAECEGCLSCTGEEPREHGSIAADVIHEYVLDRVLTRLEAEPDLLQRSVLSMREDDGLEPEALRLAVLYLIRQVYVGGPSLPLDEQVQIVWRIPEPPPAMPVEKS
jgi:hypothetical protein